MSNASDATVPASNAQRNAPYPQKNTVGPQEFRCLVGKEWKPIDAFSKKNLLMIQRKLRPGNKLDPANTGMTCRQHSEGVVEELKCMGPCSAIKPLHLFSKNTRKTGVNWCTACSAWATTCSPGMTPFAAPNNPVSFDESRRVYNVLDVTDEVFDIDDGQPLAPLSELGSLKLDDDDRDTDLTFDDSKSRSEHPSTTGARTSTTTTPHNTTAVDTASTSGATSVVAGENLPPHLRNGSRLISSRPEPRQPINYTAYDSQGRPHQKTKIPTVPSSTTGTSTRPAPSVRAPSNKRSNWAKPTLLPTQAMRNFQFEYLDPDPVLGDSESEDEI